MYGADEVSTINQRRLVLARRIVTKLVATAAMSDAPAIRPRTLTQPYCKGGRTLIQIFPRRVRLAAGGQGVLGRGMAGMISAGSQPAHMPAAKRPVAACSCEHASRTWASMQASCLYAESKNTS